MKNLKPLVYARFSCRIALVQFYEPKLKLQRLVDRIDRASRRRRPGGYIEPGLILGSTYSAAWQNAWQNTAQVYPASYASTADAVYQVYVKCAATARAARAASQVYAYAYSSFFASWNPCAEVPLTPSQLALRAARQCLANIRLTMTNDAKKFSETFEEAAAKLTRHYPLEALSLL